MQGRWRSDCSDGTVGAAITAAAALMQRLRRQWHWCSDCGGSDVGAEIAAMAALACSNGSIGIVIVVAVSAIIAVPALVGAAISVMAAFEQRLRTVIAAILFQ